MGVFTSYEMRKGVNKMCITNKLTDYIDFSLSKDRPMKITYHLSDDSLLIFYCSKNG